MQQERLRAAAASSYWRGEGSGEKEAGARQPAFPCLSAPQARRQWCRPERAGASALRQERKGATLTCSSAGRLESRSCLGKRKYTDAVEAPCPHVVSSAKSEKIDHPVAAQMASSLACLRSSARFARSRRRLSIALVKTSLRGSCSSGPGWWQEQHG